MAYESTEAIHKLNIGMQDNTAFNGLKTSLEQPSVQGRINKNQKTNVDPSMNGNSPKQINGKPISQPQANINKEEIIEAGKIDKAQSTKGIVLSAEFIAMQNIKTINNPFLR